MIEIYKELHRNVDRVVKTKELRNKEIKRNEQFIREDEVFLRLYNDIMNKKNSEN